MKQHLLNLAQILLLDKCKELNIDCSGSCTIKHPRKQIYMLITKKEGYQIIEITFHKTARPSYFIFNR